MDRADIRRHNLGRLLEERFKGVAADLARAIERSDSYVWQLLNGSRSMGEKIARHIEDSLKLERNALDDESSALRVSEPIAHYAIGRVPVVGTAQLGDNGFHVEIEHPVGFGEGFVAYPTRDKGAYALRVRGDSMRPRVKPGEFVVVEPGRNAEPGEEVLVKTKDGRVMVKVLDFRRNGVVQLSSVNEAFKPVTIEESDIELLHYVAAIVKPSLFFSEIN